MISKNMKVKVATIFLFALSLSKVQGQTTVVYSYDTTGDCTARTLSSQMLSKSITRMEAKKHRPQANIKSVTSTEKSLTVTANLANGKQQVPFTLVNPFGQTIVEGFLKDGNNTIPVPPLPSGIYIFNISGAGYTNQYKFSYKKSVAKKFNLERKK